MKPDQALSSLAKRVGVLPNYRDLAGMDHPTSRESMLALLRATGWSLDNDAMIFEAWKQSEAKRKACILPYEIIIEAGQRHKVSTPVEGTWKIVLGNEDEHYASGRATNQLDFPPLPMGIHHLSFTAGQATQNVRVIAAPAKAPSVREVAGKDKLWGVNLALYGVHSTRNPGLGDYEDLRNTASAFSSHGADFLGINPVHAIGWHSKDVISPYSPSHRGFLNTRHLALDKIGPVSGTTQRQIAVWKDEVRKRQSDRVDYRFHDETQQPLLLALYEDFKRLGSSSDKSRLEQFTVQQGESLDQFATFECLSVGNGSGIQDDEKAFHIWLQWNAEMQMQTAQSDAKASGMAAGLYLDLAVGSRRDGAEAYTERDSLAVGVSIGAPPDHLSPAGQNWNLTAFAPQKLADENYGAFSSILARNMRHCGILRIDHVLGLNRSFWLPDDGTPGAYVRQNFESMLAVIRIEAARAGTVVIGEDLGLVPSGFRKALSDSGIYSYSVLQYEKTSLGAFRKPSQLRSNSLACFGTHDTPTLAGFQSARDVDWWEKLGWINEKEAHVSRQKREEECASLQSLSSQPRLNQAVHSALAGSPVAMISVQLDDLEEQPEAQNLPGTIHEHPNWQRRSDMPVDKMQDDARIAKMGLLMRKYDRGMPNSSAEAKH